MDKSVGSKDHEEFKKQNQNSVSRIHCEVLIALSGERNITSPSPKLNLIWSGSTDISPKGKAKAVSIQVELDVTYIERESMHLKTQK